MQSYTTPTRLSIDESKKKPYFFTVLLTLRGWLGHQIGLQKDNVFLWWPVFFALGVAAYFFLWLEPPLIFSVFIFSVCLSIYLLFRNDARRFISGILFVSVLISAGFCAGSFRSYMVDTPIITKKSKYKTITATILSIEKMEEGDGSRLLLSDLNIEDLLPENTPKKIRLRLRADDGAKVGQRIKVLAMLNPPSLPLYPDGFDFRRYLYFQGIGAVGFIYHAPEILKPAPNRIFDSEALRQLIAQKIREVLPPRESSVAIALIVGQKNAISDGDRQAVRDAGMAHMLAISGLHVGLLAGAVLFLVRFTLATIPYIALHYPIKKIAAICALCAAIFYMVLAGATIPTQRAVLMSAIVFLAIILDRSPISLRLVAFSALVVLAVSPESLLSASFHMSFGAVICLIYFYDTTRLFWINQYKHGGAFRKILLYFIGVCLTTVIASIATAPFSLYHFGQVSFLGSVANLIAVPLLAFIIMPFALLGLILMLFGLEYWPMQAMGMGVEGMLDISYWAAALPASVIRMPAWGFLSFLYVICGGLWIILWKGWGKVLALPLFCASALIANYQQMPNIMVAASHKLFGFWGGDGELYISSYSSKKFVRKNWEEYYGLEEGAAKKLEFKGGVKSEGSSFGQCGEAGCRFDINGYKLSFLRLAYNQYEECAWAQVIISVSPIDKKKCAAPVIIDKFDTWKNGAYSLYLPQNGAVHYDYVIHNKKRPWSGLSKD